MKIIGQSVTAPKMTYLHLAYIAAKTLKPNPASLGISGLFFITGFVLLLVVVPLRKRKMTDNKTKSVDKIHSWGTIFVFVGFTFLVLGYVLWGTLENKHPKMLTNALMLNMESDYNCEASWEKDLIKNKDKFIDGWNNKLKVEKNTVDGKSQYQVTSAGEDGKFGTKDDLSRTLKKYISPE